MNDSHHYWVGRLSSMVGEVAKAKDPKPLAPVARECLAEFIRSPVPSEELRVILRRYMK